MPLYECSKCHAVENTALSNYWKRKAEGLPRLCSACDPEIGKWHGVFDKMTMDAYFSFTKKSWSSFPSSLPEALKRSNQETF